MLYGLAYFLDHHLKGRSTVVKHRQYSSRMLQRGVTGRRNFLYILDTQVLYVCIYIQGF